jgi:hypothetical protein
MAASIQLDRKPGGWVDRARAYKVLIDGQPVGEIRHGESQVFTVAPGRHEVHMKIDWARSPSVELELPEGGVARLHCRPNANPLTVLWYITFGRGRYVWLERAEGQLPPQAA